jgi:hypothetical protein
MLLLDNILASVRARRHAWLLCACMAGVFAGAAGVACAAGPSDYDIKAAFLYNFTKFVEWPQGAFPGVEDPIVVGVLGAPQCAEALEQLVKTRKVSGRSIVVRRVATAQEAKSAHVLFVGVDEATQFARMLPALQGAPVLTVGESSDFTGLGGEITFVLEDSKVRFEINSVAAERAGLKISAQLLKLARPSSRSS